MIRGPRTVPTTADQRRTTRLACSISIRLQPAGGAPVQATVLDLSRRGARLRVPGALLGVYQQAPLAVVARRVATALGESFEAVLGHERLGTMITKTLRPVRIGHRDGSLSDVELGCLMQPPLSDLEASMLGVPLPMLRADGTESQARLEVQSVVVRVSGAKPEPKAASPAAASAAAPAPAAAPASAQGPAQASARPPRPSPPPVVLANRTAGRPAAPEAPVAAAPAPASPGPVGPSQAHVGEQPVPAAWRAYVHPTGERRVAPFLAAAESVSSKGVLLRVLERAALALPGASDVASTIQSLDQVYGGQVALKLSDGPTHLWTGPACIAEVEVPSSHPEQVLVWLAFGRALRAAELRALGLQ